MNQDVGNSKTISGWKVAKILMMHFLLSFPRKIKGLLYLKVTLMSHFLDHLFGKFEPLFGPICLQVIILMVRVIEALWEVIIRR